MEIFKDFRHPNQFNAQEWLIEGKAISLFFRTAISTAQI